MLVIGAGIGGLTAAALLAARGLDVTILERAATVGGKVRQLPVAGRMVDAGPTVFTLRPVLEAVFAECGRDLAAMVPMQPLAVLARHHWPDGSRLDLHADPEASADAVGALCGAAEARAFRAFAAESAAIWNTLDQAFVQQPLTGPLGLTLRLGLSRLAELSAVRPYESYWSALNARFRDPRLVQLFARYATYCGCSPMQAPATLMLIAHVESAGVWRIEGGLSRLAAALAELVADGGGRIRCNSTVASILCAGGRAAGVELADGERLFADSIIANCDPAALADGLFGADVRRAVRATPRAARSLSALTWMAVGRAGPAPLADHNIVFSGDYPREFAAIAAGRLPDQPSVYLCAPDAGAAGAQRFQIIVNAPPRADSAPLSAEEIDRCETTMQTCLRSGGLWPELTDGGCVRQTPTDYHRLFPSTGGALYGRASHGALGSFLRPGSRTRIPGLFLAGGGVHPGAGVPMAALSGRLACAAVLAERSGQPRRWRFGPDWTAPASTARASTTRSRPAAMPGGISTPCPTAADTG